MITTTYTEAELVTSLRGECEEVLAYSDIKQPKFDKLVRKRTGFPVYAHSEYISKANNRWLIFFEARARFEIGDNSRVTSCCLLNTEKGRHAYKTMFINNVFKIAAFPPHFFRRFAERLGLDLTGEALIIRFFERNASLTIYANGGTVCAASAEGILMGRETVAHNYLFKTFLTRDMAKRDQDAAFSYLTAMRDELDAPIKLEND